MKLRHPAALALVGWYLILPPLDYSRAEIILKAPLRDWETFQSFETAKDCNEFHATYVRNVAVSTFVRNDSEEDARVDRESHWQSGTAAKNRRIGLDRARLGFCIASDDPRLKVK